jgi:putative tricarboxylic transport membrane protein
MIVVSCAIGAYAIQNAMFGLWLTLGFGGSAMSSIRSGFRWRRSPWRWRSGNRAEDAFLLSMIGSGGDMKVFWSNGLVGSITTLAIVLLFWPAIKRAFAGAGRLWRPAKTAG